MRRIHKNLARFCPDLIRSMPRPAGYVRELRACAERIEPCLWEFDEDSACFKRLRAKYRDYVPTAEDLARVAIYQTEQKVRRDELTRALWGELHRRALSLKAIDPAAELRWLKAWRARVPCGECKGHWDRIVAEDPPDPSSPATYTRWTWRAHNRVNEIAGRAQFPWEAFEATWGNRIIIAVR